MSHDPPSGVPLRLFNSLTRKIEAFVPVHPGEARVYTCGPTVYNYPHIGNMRAYVFADVLGRTLSWKGYKLTHVINITDVGHLTDDADTGEDKLEKAAAQNAQSIWEIARHYTEAYWADINALNIRGPMKEGVAEQSYWSIATDYVPKMIKFAESIEKHCYQLVSGLYFDTSSVTEYGKLAGRTKLDQIEDNESAWMRIDEIKDKRHAADFAIWRKTPDGETRQMEWDSPWGKGAPGWHLECSVMSGELLGFPFDIHTGGIDHREIHHPNEIAQNQAFCHSDASGANIWMHNNFLVERSGKMSKSAGEFLRLQLLIDKGYHPLAYRLMCLQAHYRSELEFSWEGLQAALVRLKRLVMAVTQLKARHAELVSASIAPPQAETQSARWTLNQVQGDEELTRFASNIDGIDKTLSDDLNTAVAIVTLDAILAIRNQPPQPVLKAIAAVDAVLGLELLKLTRTDLRIRPKSATTSEPEIEAILARREEARAAKDFATSDALRNELAAQGVEVMDGDPLGWDWNLG